MSRKSWLKIILGLLVFLSQSAAAVEINGAIEQLVRERYQLDSASFEISILSSQLRTRSVNPVDLTLRSLTQSQPVGPFTLIVEISRDSAVMERGQVHLMIRKFAEVMVAADKIGRYDLLQPEKFELKRTDVTSLREQPVVSAAEIAGQRARRNLRVGSILTTAALEPVPDIEVGGEVTIVFTDKWGTITVPGRALESGSIGARVRVRNLASGKVLLAAVVSNKSVEVNP